MTDLIRLWERWYLSGIVVTLLVVGTLVVAVLEKRSRQQQIARNSSSLNNLRNVALATHQYSVDSQGVIPAGGRRSDVEPQWSWAVRLLPYIEQERSYRSVDFSQLWNSDQNRKWLSFEIRIFLNPSESDRNPVDGFAITHQTANSRVFGPREGISLDQAIRWDGTDSTLMLGEIGTAFPPWAKPGNVRDPARGLGGGPEQWGRSDGSGCNVFFLGGNAKNLSPDISPEVLELLADPNNGVPKDDEF